mgnify:CR=1 FL=1
MESRNLFNYKCHNCKQTKEPDEFGYNNQTKTKRVTCNVCHRKKSERAKALKESRAQAQAAAADNHYEYPSGVDHIMSDTTTEEEETRIVAYIPLATSEEEPVCENACFNRLVCNAVRARFTCGHLQCVQTHLAIGYCIACGCSTLRYNHVIILGNGASSSSSGPAIPEADRQPEEEPEPETEDPLSYFVTEHP